MKLKILALICLFSTASFAVENVAPIKTEDLNKAEATTIQDNKLNVPIEVKREALKKKHKLKKKAALEAAAAKSTDAANADINKDKTVNSNLNDIKVEQNNQEKRDNNSNR